MNDSVKNGVSDSGVMELRVPFVNWNLREEHAGAEIVPGFNKFEKKP